MSINKALTAIVAVWMVRNNRMRRRFPALLAVVALAVGGRGGTATAGLVTWSGNTDTNWSNTANWSPAQEPGSGDVAYFANMSYANNPTLTNNIALGGIRFGAGATGNTVRLDGVYTLSLGTGVVDSAGYGYGIYCENTKGTNFIGVASLDLVCTQTWYAASGGYLDFSNAVVTSSGGARNLTKAGAGTLRLRGANTYSGTTVLGSSGYSGGTVAFLDDGRLTATPSLDVGYGHALTLDNTGSANNSDRLNDAAPIALRGGTLSFLGRTNTASSETVGTVTLTNGYNTINASAGGGSGTAALTLGGLVRNAGGGVVNFTGANLGTSTNKILFNGQGDSTFLGPWAMVNLALASGDWAKYDSSGSIGVKAFAASDYGTTNETTWGSSTNALLNVNGLYTLNLTASRALNTLKIADAGGVATLALGTNSLNLYGGGVLAYGNGQTHVISASGGGYLTAGGASAGELVVSVAPAAFLTISASIQDNSGPGAVTLDVSGAGAVRVAGTNTFSGGCVLNGGKIFLATAAAGALGTGPFTINGGSLGCGSGAGVALANSSHTWNGDFTIGDQSANSANPNFGTAPVTLTRNVTVTHYVNVAATVAGPMTNNYDLTVLPNGAGNLTLSGNIAGSGRIISGGSSGGYVILSGANTFTGGIVLNGAGLKLGSTTALGAASGALTINGGNLDTSVAMTMANANPQVWNNSFTFIGTQNLTLPGNVTLNTNVTVTLSSGGGSTLTESGVISGGYGLTTAGSAALALSNANTFAGATTVGGATTLKLQNALALQNSTLTPAGGTVTFNSGIGTFTLGGLGGTGNLSMMDSGAKAIGLSVGNNSNNTTYAGILYGTGASTGALIKVGTGILTLTGGSTNLASTIVSNGTLLVNGGLSNGPVTVVSAGTLGGSGMIRGVVTNSGTLAAGGVGTVGTLTLATNLVMQSGSAIAWDWASGSNDAIMVNGSLTLGAGNSYTVRLGKVGSAGYPQGDYTLIQYAGVDPADIGTWTVDPGTTGWTAKVAQDTINHRLLLRLSTSGTTLIVR